jgi:hypothetical protein
LTLELTKSLTRHHSNDSGIWILVRGAFFRRPSMESTVAVHKNMIWLIIAFFSSRDVNALVRCFSMGPTKNNFESMSTFIQSEFIFPRIDHCFGSTRHFRRTKNQRIDLKVPRMSMQVCFDVFHDVDTLFGSNDGSIMVDCLINHA